MIACVGEKNQCSCLKLLFLMRHMYPYATTVHALRRHAALACVVLCDGCVGQGKLIESLLFDKGGASV